MNNVSAQYAAATDTKLAELMMEEQRIRRQLEINKAQQARLDEDYSNMGGWGRFYLVTDGHLHRSTSCSTCYITTQFHWMTQLSGKSQDEIVELAGERACTVCFPDAPVDVTNRPSQLSTEEEAARDYARLEREAKAAAAKSETVGNYKTERAASNAIGSALADLRWYGAEHPTAAEWEQTAAEAIAALAAKQGVDASELRAEFEAKADKKHAALIRKSWKELKAACASGRYSRSIVDMDSETVQYGKSIGEELQFVR